MMHTPAHHHSWPLAQPAQIEITGPAVDAGPDFLFVSHGSVIVLTPWSDAAKEWVDENLPEDAQRWGRGIAIEPRYWDDIADGIVADGLDIR